MRCLLALALLSLCASIAAAQQQLTFVEELVTTPQPVRQHVIVPVQSYRPALFGPGYVPVTRREERIQTTYVPVTRRAYRPVLETSTRPMPPLKLATRPSAAVTPRSLRVYDNLPVEPISRAVSGVSPFAPRK